MQDFASAVAEFTYAEELRGKQETLRQQFLERFPVSCLAAMTLEQYCLGLEPKENSFCNWLEYRTYELGRMGGGDSNKFVVFYSPSKGQYVFDSRYETKEQAFEAVKTGLIELLRFAEDDKFIQCDSVQPLVTVLRGKLLNMYFPNKFLPIFSLDHLKDLCSQFRVQTTLESPTLMNLALLKFKHESALVGGWSNDKFAKFLYEKYPRTVQFWKIAPGDNARLWHDCLQGGFICIGWKEIGDMRQYTDAAAFRDIYRELHGSNRQCSEIWSFANEVKKGDIIVANKGLQLIVGIGTVVGDYWHDDNRAEYKHCVPVKWDITTQFPIPESAREKFAKRWFQGTLKKLDRQEYDQLLAGGTDGDTMIDVGATEAIPRAISTSRYAQICSNTFLPEKFFIDCEKLLETKKQIVLQGAPGTGKTFVAEQLATLWAGASERVKVVQFHESYGYEDFVHGLKPSRDPITKQTAFVPTQGIFLRFCEEIRRDETTPQRRYVLLIDEINRAKTARVFGELLYLLEYRENTVELQDGTPFSIPPNLYIIGTMNTTDKSIALVDYALRRRFAFVDLVPVKDGQSVVLKKWLESKGISNAAEVDGLFIALNEAIALKDEALMVGHSYFMLKQALEEKRFSPELLNFMWDYYILPLIAEYEYQSTRAELEEKYGLTALRKTLK